jgi:eukaryotic-like serine/threonine-protein kinase
LRFLIVDDDPEYRQLLRYHLEVEWPDATIEEHQPTSAHSLPQGLSVAALDLILLGHPLARDEGFALLKGLRARPNCPPIFVFANPSDEFVAVDALKSGAASYFPKDKVRHHRLVDSIRTEMRTDSPGEDTGSMLVNHKAMNGARKRRLLGKLYAGELSSVYLAETEDTGERIAFKVLRHVPDSGGSRTFDRFLQEYEVIARVRHPNVVKIFDLGIADDHAYIAMEFLGAGSLAERLSAALDPGLAVQYAREIGSALAAIHEASILHRDLKPANIMFREDGTLALIDFGLAKQMRLHAAITGTGQIFGTPYYMSPEQGHAEPTDPRSDIYSLGCMLYEMLTGERPFTASSPMGVIYRHAHAPRPRLPRSVTHLQPVLDRMLAVERLARYQSAREFLADLQVAAG